jgi:hypothetical protein
MEAQTGVQTEVGANEFIIPQLAIVILGDPNRPKACSGQMINYHQTLRNDKFSFR